MSPLAVVLVFVGIPLLVVAAVFALVYGLSRPGRRSEPDSPDGPVHPDGRAGGSER